MTRRKAFVVDADHIAGVLCGLAGLSTNRAALGAEEISAMWRSGEDCAQFLITAKDGRVFDVVVRERD